MDDSPAGSPPRAPFSLVEPTLFLGLATAFLYFVGLVRSEAKHAVLGVAWSGSLDVPRYATVGFKSLGAQAIGVLAPALLVAFLLRRWKYAPNAIAAYGMASLVGSNLLIYRLMLRGGSSDAELWTAGVGMAQTSLLYVLVLVAVVVLTARRRGLASLWTAPGWRRRAPLALVGALLVLGYAHDSGVWEAARELHLTGLPDATVHFADAEASPLEGRTLMLLLRDGGNVYLAEREVAGGVRPTYVVREDALRDLVVERRATPLAWWGG